MADYWALIHEDETGFGISFPDVPGCISAGRSVEEAISEGSDALSAHLAWLKAEGDAVPQPRPLAELRGDPKIRELAEDATWQLVRARTVQAPRVRVNIMIDPGLLREADEAAEAAGMTRSGLIEAALRDRMSPELTGFGEPEGRSYDAPAVGRREK